MLTCASSRQMYQITHPIAQVNGIIRGQYYGTVSRICFAVGRCMCSNPSIFSSRSAPAANRSATRRSSRARVRRQG